MHYVISSYYWSFYAVEPVVTPKIDTQRPVEDEDCRNLMIKCCHFNAWWWFRMNECMKTSWMEFMFIESCQKLTLTGSDEREEVSFSTFFFKKKFSWLSGLFKIKKTCGLPSISSLCYHLYEPDFLGCAVWVIMVQTLGCSDCQLTSWQTDWTHRRPATQHSEGLAEQKLSCQAKQQPAFPQNPSWQGLKDNIKHLKRILSNMRIFQKHTMSLLR